MNISRDTARLLRRKEAARYLSEKRGLPVAPQTLAKLAVVGGGPAFRKFGRFPLYDVSDLNDWADAQLGPPRRSTSDAKAATEPTAVGVKLEGMSGARNATEAPLLHFRHCPKCGADLRGASGCRRCGPMPMRGLKPSAPKAPALIANAKK